MTLINPKYTYEKLKRVEVGGKRRYAAPGGPPVASVTTILSGTKDMTHLHEWRRRVGEKKAQEVVVIAQTPGTLIISEGDVWHGSYPCTTGKKVYVFDFLQEIL